MIHLSNLKKFGVSGANVRLKRLSGAKSHKAFDAVLQRLGVCSFIGWNDERGDPKNSEHVEMLHEKSLTQS